MAPQCIGMAGWGRRNLIAHPDSSVVQQSLRTSHHLGTICANCAFMQLSEGRHYFIEQPKGSDLYTLPIFQRLSYATGANDFEKWCYMDMCMVGLRSSRGLLLKKPSELWASSEHLLWRFRRRLCNGQHEHDTTQGGRVCHLKSGHGFLHDFWLMASLI